MNNNSLHRLIYICLLSAAAAVAATTAYFADSKLSRNNTFTAGTLDLSLEENAPQSASALGGIDWQPGSEFEGRIDLKNDGTIPMGSVFLQAQSETSE